MKIWEIYMKKLLLILGIIVSSIGCSNNTSTTLDPNNPIHLTVWHYYNGASQAAFDDLCQEFNNTVGKEEGIVVEGYSQGSISDLESAINASCNKEVGAEELPNIFSTYVDTAYSIQDKTELVDLKDYFSDDELSEYVDSFVQEGYINNDDHLYLFPIAKSTEIFMINKTDFEEFANAYNISYKDLSTIEGIIDVSEKYYEYSNGKAFYGRDSMSNYFIIGMKQLGTEIFEVDETGNVTLNIDKDKIKKLWECYYVPYVKGYFTSLGKFRSDDVKTGDILAYTGSSSSAVYFPDTVENGSESKNIEYVILPAPTFKDGTNAVVQQGAGMVVTKKSEKESYASCVFLKWFTEAKNNIYFSSESAYLPVKKDAFNTDTFYSVINENDLDIQQKTEDVIEYVIEDGSLLTSGYTTKPFKNGADARKVLDSSLSDQAIADKEEIDALVESGKDREEVLKSYTSDASFEKWYEQFSQTLNEKIK